MGTGNGNGIRNWDIGNGIIRIEGMGMGLGYRDRGQDMRNGIGNRDWEPGMGMG